MLLKRTVVGAFWTVTTGVGSRAVGLVGTLLLTRFLTPDDYGEVSIAQVVIQTAHVISLAGINQFMFSKARVDRATAFHATFYYTLLGLAAFALVTALRAPVSALFGAPGMSAYLPGLVIAAAIERIAALLERVQIRALRFRSLGLLRTASEVVFVVATIGLAWAGYGGQAVVVGSILRSVVRLGLFLLTTEWRAWLMPCRLDAARTREVFAFGVPMSIAGIAGFASKRWDNLAIAYLFGPAQAGMYNLAYNLADIPSAQVGDAVGDVLTGALRNIDSDEQRRRALLRSLPLLTLIISPLSVGLAAVAPTVTALFDPRWAAVGPMLAVLSATSVVRPVGWLGNTYLQIKNMPRSIMVLEVSKAVMLLGMIALLGRLGPLFACAAVGLVFAVNSLGYVWVIHRADRLSYREILGPMLPPLLACIPMALAVVALQGFLSSTARITRAEGLFAEVLLGALVFAPSALLLAPRASSELLELLRGGLRRRSREASGAGEAG